MRQPPPDTAPLWERVHWVLTDMDPERLGRDATAYDAVAVPITARLNAAEPLTPEELGSLWGWAFGDDAWLLQPPHRLVLNQLTRRLQQLQQPSLPSATDSPGAVSELGPGATGRWLIASRGSVHVLDLDARTYERRPGPTSQAFDYDNQPVVFTRIELWPKVGGQMLIWFDYPVHPELIEHYRACSRIRSITRDAAGAL